MLASILRAPIVFFDTTPIGRILNMFSRDIETVDVVLPAAVRFCIDTFFGVFAVLVIISYSTPAFLAVILPLFIVYYLMQVTDSKKKMSNPHDNAVDVTSPKRRYSIRIITLHATQNCINHQTLLTSTTFILLSDMSVLYSIYLF